MKIPRVSICLPNLNNRAYLQERIDTIKAQTLTDWELVICDNYSEDGAWELFQDIAKNDVRVRISQKPREGMYANWNNCIREARCEFVYVATSDDTMASDCLEKMVSALDKNPECDVAHCPMKVINQQGDPGLDWWCRSSLFAKSSADMIKIPHKRLAPYDGILCLLGDNIYSSVTQLLLRRSLFDKVGLYQTDWGSLGDFHWNLRVGLAASAVHVPDTWGGWRMHPSQATAAVGLNSPAHQAKIDDMIADVLVRLDQYVESETLRATILRLAPKAAAMKTFLREQQRIRNPVGRHLFLIRQALTGSRPAWLRIMAMISGGGRWPDVAPRTLNVWFKQPVMVPIT